MMRHLAGVPGMGVLLLGVALASGAGAAIPPRGSDRVVAQFARGAGPGELGVTDDNPGALPLGPNGMIDANGGGVLILDTVNNRILRVNPAGKVSVAAAVAGAGLAQDIVRAGTAVYVLDTQPVFIGFDSGAGKIGGSRTSESGSGRQSAPGLFEASGAVFDDAGTSQQEASDGQGQAGKWLSGPGVNGATDQYRIVRRDGQGAAIELRPGGRENAARMLALPGPAGRLGSIGLIGSDNAGRAYVRIEEFSSAAGEGRAKVWVVRYDKLGKADGGYDVPDDRMELVPNRYLAVSPAGEVYFLESRRDKTRLLALHAIPEEAFPGHRRDVMARLAGAPHDGRAPEAAATMEAGPGTAKTSRSAILAMAEAFRTAQWTLGSKNFRATMVSACVPSKGQLWRRPPQLDKMEGKLITGVPYNWGGSMTVAQFQDRILKNAVAGNVCTCRADSNCVDSKIAGVDCSGFLSQVWQVGHHTTATLKDVSKKLHSYADLRPGDALNKPNAHVRLFVSHSPNGNGTLRAYESSVSCGGVCLRDFTSKQLEGYLALGAPTGD